VGPDEFDAKAGRISIQSPLGKALLGKNLDDAVTVDRPKGRVEITIVDCGPSDRVNRNRGRSARRTMSFFEL